MLETLHTLILNAYAQMSFTQCFVTYTVAAMATCEMANRFIDWVLD